MALYSIQGHDYDEGSSVLLEHDSADLDVTELMADIERHMRTKGIRDGFMGFNSVVEEVLVGELGFRYLSEDQEPVVIDIGHLRA